MGLEWRKTKKSEVRAEENQEKQNKCGGKPRKVVLERKKTKKKNLEWEKTKKSAVRAAEIREKHG